MPQQVKVHLTSRAKRVTSAQQVTSSVRARNVNITKFQTSILYVLKTFGQVFYPEFVKTPLLRSFLTPIALCKGFSSQGPVVQSVVSLTSSLRVISLTVLADSIYKILKFFAEKM